MEYNKLIDHTNLKPTATPEDIHILCQEAIQYEFMSVCVNSCYTKLAKIWLIGTDIKVCTVVGFPLGAMSTDSKVMEAKNAIRDGADEIDMVMNIGMFKSGDYDYIEKEFKAMKKACAHKVLKIILETCLLTDEEIVTATLIAKNSGAEFVKTSTGFSTGGATVEAVALMKENCGKWMNVKASGGIKTLADVDNMVAAGATRIGTSNSVKIMKEIKG